MAGFGNLLLGMLGQTDPEASAIAQLLGGGSGTRTPGATGIAPRGGAPGAPAQPSAYSSPTDLMEMYESLSKRQRKEKMIDRGFGLAASAFAQPENRELIMRAFGGDEERMNPLDVVTGIAEQRSKQAALEADAANKERQLASLPAISEQYGVDMDAARMLFDNGQLDDFIMEKSKYQAADTELVDTPNGKALIESGTGRIIKEYGKAVPDPTNDMQNLDRANLDRAKAGEPPLTMEQWVQLGKPTGTTINNNMGPQADAAMLKVLDDKLGADFTAAQESVQTISRIQEARRALDSSGGIVSGDITAPIRLETMKLASTLFGIPSEAASNTETFQANMKEIVLPLVKQLGTGNSISNADREFVEKAIGGDIRLIEGAMRRILAVMERGQRNRIIQANEKMGKRVSKSAPDSALRDAYSDIEVPELSGAAVQDLIENIPSGHIANLIAIKNGEIEGADLEEAAKQFDAKYGFGASQIVLGAQ